MLRTKNFGEKVDCGMFECFLRKNRTYIIVKLVFEHMVLKRKIQIGEPFRGNDFPRALVDKKEYYEIHLLKNENGKHGVPKLKELVQP